MDYERLGILKETIEAATREICTKLEQIRMGIIDVELKLIKINEVEK